MDSLASQTLFILCVPFAVVIAMWLVPAFRARLTERPVIYRDWRAAAFLGTSSGLAVSMAIAINPFLTGAIGQQHRIAKDPR